MEVVRMKLTIPQYDVTSVRWVEATDTFEIQLPDGSWATYETGDYRRAESGRLPARIDTDKRCLSAANATQAVRDTIDATLGTFNEIGIASAALGVGLAFIPELVSKGFAIGFAFASLALSIGSEILIESFDTDAYDAIQCALYCAADSSGQWSLSRLNSALNAIHDDPFIDDYADVVTSFILYTLWGEVGTSNAGTMGKVTSATCSCDCQWRYSVYCPDTSGLWGLASSPTWGVLGFYTAGVGFTQRSSQASSSGWATQLFIGIDIPTSTTLTKVSVECSGAWGVDADNIKGLKIVVDGATVYTKTSAVSNFEWNGSISSVDHVDINSILGYDGYPPPYANPGGTMTITRVTLEGQGDCPFPIEDCG